MEPKPTTKKIVTSGLIIWASVVGSVVGSFYFLYKNSVVLNDGKKNSILISGIIATIAVASILVFLPENILDRLPNALIPLLLVVGTYVYFNQQQKQGIALLLEKGDAIKYSKIKVTGIALLCALLTMFIILVVSLFKLF
jgi:hypothetical protein